MDKLFSIFAISLFALSTAGMQSCNFFGGRVEGRDFRFMISPTLIPGGGPVGGELHDLGISLPLGDALPKSVVENDDIEEIYIDEIVLRSTLPGDYDAQGKPVKSRMIDEELAAQPCADGQQPLDFVDTFKLFVKKDDASPEILLASYDRAGRTGICSVYLEFMTDPETQKSYNLKPFLPNFVVRTELTAVKPVNDTRIGGYLAISFVAPHANPIYK